MTTKIQKIIKEAQKLGSGMRCDLDVKDKCVSQ